MESLEGQLLLASPQLLDPNFVRTVVLLVEHNDMGALGLVINRPTGKTVQELWKQVGESPCESQQPVHLGGPVSGPLMAIHTADGLAEMEIAEGVFFAAKKQNLDELVRRDVPFQALCRPLRLGPRTIGGRDRAGGLAGDPRQVGRCFRRCRRPLAATHAKGRGRRAAGNARNQAYSPRSVAELSECLYNPWVSMYFSTARGVR